MAQIFVSYRDVDIDARNSFNGLLLASTEIIDVPVIDRENFRGTSEADIRRYLRSQIGQCSALVLLLGNSTHNGPWILYEIQVALSQNKPIFAVRIPGTTGGLPPILHDDVELVNWDSREIRDKLNRLFGRRF